MIVIINYGLGNIQSFKNLFQRKGIKFIEIKDNEDLSKVSCFLLPGVGSFDDAIKKLQAQKFFGELDKIIKKKLKPILGVCVGMQIMFENSDEGKLKGLNWLEGTVKRIGSEKKNKGTIILPHLGWNNINIKKNHPLFYNIENLEFYFLHSYMCISQTEHIFASTTYYDEINSVVIKDNIYGIQFHPEKSHSQGENLLINYIKMYVET